MGMAGHNHHGVRDTFRGQFRDPAKAKVRLPSRAVGAAPPKESDDRLLVANEDVAPRQEIKKLAIAKQIAPIIALGVSRFDDELGNWMRHGRCDCSNIRAHAQRGRKFTAVKESETRSVSPKNDAMILSHNC